MEQDYEVHSLTSHYDIYLNKSHVGYTCVTFKGAAHEQLRFIAIEVFFFTAYDSLPGMVKASDRCTFLATELKSYEETEVKKAILRAVDANFESRTAQATLKKKRDSFKVLFPQVLGDGVLYLIHDYESTPNLKQVASPHGAGITHPFTVHDDSIIMEGYQKIIELPL